MSKDVSTAGARDETPRDAGADDTQGAPATCSTCGSTGLVESRISTAFRSGDHWAVIKEIPAIVCSTCQEQFVDDATAVRLDMMRANGFSSQEPVDTMTVPVYAFQSDSGRRS